MSVWQPMCRHVRTNRMTGVQSWNLNKVLKCSAFSFFLMSSEKQMWQRRERCGELRNETIWNHLLSLIGLKLYDAAAAAAAVAAAAAGTCVSGEVSASPSASAQEVHLLWRYQKELRRCVACSWQGCCMFFFFLSPNIAQFVASMEKNGQKLFF